MAKLWKYLMIVLTLGTFLFVNGCATSIETVNQQGSECMEGVNKCEESKAVDSSKDMEPQEKIKARSDMSRILPFESVINPCQTDDQKQAEVDLKDLLNNAIKHFESKDVLELMKNPDGSIPIHMEKNPDGGVMGYKTAIMHNKEEIPVIVTSLGLGFNDLAAHGVIWQENNTWYSQPYPQVEKNLADQRKKAFKNSPFCGRNILEIHPIDNLLLVLVEHGMTKAGQEVHLLQYKNGKWEAVWAPSYLRWEELYMTRIEFAPDKKSFTAYKTDIKNPNKQWEEVYKLDGLNFVLVSSTKK